jgi:hypothetical protein
MFAFVLVASLFGFFASELLAYQPEKCFGFVAKNGLREYDFPGYFSYEYMTKKYGTTQGTSQSSSQSVTFSVDPTVSTNKLVSTVQFSSSWGDCDYFGFFFKQRSEYIARNKKEFGEQMAMGRGEHLKVYHYFLGCDPTTYDSFRNSVQNSYIRVEDQLVEDSDANVRTIDAELRSNKDLSSSCSFLGA